MLGLFILILLILINGLFSMSEIALISAREARLQLRAQQGDKGAQAALRLAQKPSDFLATIQIGITLVAILIGAFGSTRLAGQIEPFLAGMPLLGQYSALLAGVIAVLIVTYLSLLLGELAPKQIGLNHPESIASRIAPLMAGLAWLAHPLVSFLSASTRFVMRLLRIKPSNEPFITEDEIQLMVDKAAQIGVVEPIEGEIVEQLFRVGDLRVNDLMVDRTDILWLDIDDSPQQMQAKISSNIHSRYPVARGDLDNIVGLVLVKDLLVQTLGSDTTDLNLPLKPALFVPSGLPVYQVLERFKEEQSQIAFVTDEHGGVEGLVTFIDLLEAIVGDVPELGDPQDPTAVIRADGSWLIDGKLPVEEFKQLFAIPDLPDEDEGYYQTVGGFVMHNLGRVPQAGDTFIWHDLTIEVVDMDWRRVDKVLVTRKEENS